jgi:hypothetical protein
MTTKELQAVVAFINTRYSGIYDQRCSSVLGERGDPDAANCCARRCCACVAGSKNGFVRITRAGAECFRELKAGARCAISRSTVPDFRRSARRQPFGWARLPKPSTPNQAVTRATDESRCEKGYPITIHAGR